MWRTLLWCVLALLLAAAAAAAWAFYDYRHYLTQPLTVAEASRTFTVERGWSARRVARELEAADIIDQRHWFDAYLRLSKKAGRLKSGEFELPAQLTVPELVDIFIDGRTRQYSEVIIEGSTFRELRARLSRNERLVQTITDLSDAEIMQALGAEGIHPEGQFLADTYQFPRKTTDIEYLRRARRSLLNALEAAWERRDADLPISSPYEALTLASIVEKETAVPAERPLIAGVFHSRLIKGMRLQTDPTVIYGIGPDFNGDITFRDLRTDTPYNTYTRGGLPPTPISMVGPKALQAVMHPEETSALFFVSRGDGTHQFSETLEQHEAAVRKYQLGQ